MALAAVLQQLANVLAGAQPVGECVVEEVVEGGGEGRVESVVVADGGRGRVRGSVAVGGVELSEASCGGGQSVVESVCVARVEGVCGEADGVSQGASCAGAASDDGSGSSRMSQGSTVSWADEVEEVELGSQSVGSAPTFAEVVSKPMVALPVVPVAVAVEKESETVASAGALQCIKNPRARALRVALKAAGVRVPRVADRDLAITTYTVEQQPGALVGAGDRLRVLAMLGDAAIKQELIGQMATKACTPKVVSDEVCRRLANVWLRERAQEVGLFAHLASTAADDPRVAKTGPTMVEAIAGVLAMHTSRENVLGYMRWLKISS